jgi:beta-mannosidase
MIFEYDPRQNKRLDELLRDQAQELDPTRYAHVNSGSGDAHVYPGWAYGQWWNFVDLPGAPFITQYGAQALPDLETMQRIFGPQELTYDSGEVSQRWEFHDFQSSETFDVAGVERGQSIEEFIADSQAYQANLVQFATESYRRAKYTPVQGIFYSTFVESWPSITWAVVDYYRRPKEGYFALQTAMQPILHSIAASRPAGLERNRWVYADAADFQATLWVVNDTLDAYPGARLHWRIRANTGELVKEGVASVDVPSDRVRWAAAVRNLDLPAGDYHVHVELLDAQGRELGWNQFAFTVEPPQAEAEEE